MVCVQLRRCWGAPGDGSAGANRALPISVWLREGSAVTDALPKASQLRDLLLLEQGLWVSGLCQHPAGFSALESTKGNFAEC